MALPGYAQFLPPQDLAELQRLYGYDDPSAFGLRQMDAVNADFIGPGVPLPWDSSIPPAGDPNAMVSKERPGVLTGPRGRLSGGLGPRGRTRPPTKMAQVGRPSDAPEPEHPRLNGSALPQAKAGGADAGQSILQQLMAAGIGKKKEPAKGPFGIPQSIYDSIGDTGIALMAGRKNEVGRQAEALMALRESRAKESQREQVLEQAEQRMMATAMGQDERLQSQRQIAEMRDAYQRENLARLQEQGDQGLRIREMGIGAREDAAERAAQLRDQHYRDMRELGDQNLTLRRDLGLAQEAGRNARGGMGDYGAQWDKVISSLEGQKNADGTYPPGVKERILQAQAYREAQANPRARIKDLFPSGKQDKVDTFLGTPAGPGTKPPPPPETQAAINALRSGKLSAEQAEVVRKKLIEGGLGDYIQ